eukprot:10981184-Alexandrium_andersonii.AAC.1
MSASLVGSEMCIRDRTGSATTVPTGMPLSPGEEEGRATAGAGASGSPSPGPSTGVAVGSEGTGATARNPTAEE